MRRNIDSARLLGLFAVMARIRAFEEAGLEAQKQGLVLGALHPSIGEEAVAVGVCAHLHRGDVLLSTHRGHGHSLAKGADATAMMCELFGRTGGTCGGKGGSMHIADFSVGMLGANGVVGANIGIAAGGHARAGADAPGRGQPRGAGEEGRSHRLRQERRGPARDPDRPSGAGGRFLQNVLARRAELKSAR